MTNKYLLSIIIPVYGKSPDFVKNNLLQIVSIVKEANENSNLVELIICYKNDSFFDYSGVLTHQSFNQPFIKILEANQSDKKTNKVIMGVKNSNSEYIYVIDSHHFIDKNQFNLLIHNLLHRNEDLIFLNIQVQTINENNEVIKSYVAKHGKHFFCGTYLVKTKAIKKRLKKINFDVVFGDDWTLGLLISSKINFRYKQLNLHPYIKKIYLKGDVNTTSGVKGKEQMTNFFEQSKKILNTSTNWISIFNFNSRVFDENQYYCYIDMMKRFFNYETEYEAKQKFTIFWKQNSKFYKLTRIMLYKSIMKKNYNQFKNDSF